MHLHIPASLLLAKWIDQSVQKIFGPRASGTAHGKAHLPQFFFLCAISMALVERVWPMIFPWHLGYGSLWTGLGAAQLSEFIGFQGLSSVFFLLNAFMATGFWILKQNQMKFSKTASVCFASSVALFAGMNAVGSLIKPSQKTDRNLQVLIVQANIGQFEKIAGDLGNKNLSTNHGQLQEAVLNKYIQLTNEGLAAHPKTQVIVWPETALPDYYDLDFLSRPRQQRLVAQIAQWNRALMTGAYSRDLQSGKVFNALFVFNDKGQLAAPAYRKSELLAFGEYLPFGETFPILHQLLPFVSSFGRGPGADVKKFSVAGQEFLAGPQICYESLYDSFSRQSALQGADFHVNITNDSWFGTLFEPFQHGTMNWARALETRRPLIRSTNTGQSSVILHDGEVVLKSPLNQEWYGAAQMPIPEIKNTFYVNYGHLDWILYVVVAIGLIGSLAVSLKGRHV